MTDSNDTDANRVSRRRTLKGIGVGAVALTGITSPVAASSEANTDTPVERWPQYGRDAANSGFGPQGGPRHNVSIKWEGTSPGYTAPLTGSIVVGDGMVYVNSWTDIYAFDEETGDLVWTDERGNGGWGPAVADGILYNHTGCDGDWCGDGTYDEIDMMALDAQTGETLWMTHLPEATVWGSTPTVKDGIVYAGADHTWEPTHGAMHAFDAKTGEKLWTYETRLYTPHWTPAVKYGTVYFPTTGGTYAVDAETGEEQWFQDYGGTHSPATVVNKTVYKAGGKSVFAFDAETGEKAFEGRSLWQADDHLRSAPTVVGDTIYQASGNANEYTASNSMYAIDAETGEQLWRTKIGGAYWKPAVSRGIVYTGGQKSRDDPKRFHALDAESGDILWQFEGGSILTAPALSDGDVYFGNYNARLCTFKSGRDVDGSDG